MMIFYQMHKQNEELLKDLGNSSLGINDLVMKL